ncbi:MAG: hypothetical protein IKO42_05145 [Opitutales bacterium]|nr:hypothetical protein [Opitutales bacterium]
MKKKLIFTAFLIALALQFFFPLKIVHDQYMAKKYGAEETCAAELHRKYDSAYKIKIEISKYPKLEEFAVKDKELAKFINENHMYLESEAVVRVLGQKQALVDVLVCGVSMKNPPENALEILKTEAEKRISEIKESRTAESAAKKADGKEIPAETSCDGASKSDDAKKADATPNVADAKKADDDNKAEEKKPDTAANAQADAKPSEQDAAKPSGQETPPPADANKNPTQAQTSPEEPQNK